MKKFFFLTFLFILAACSSKTEVKSKYSETEKKVDIWFKAGLKGMYRFPTSSPLYLDSIKSVSSQLSGDYKAMEHLLESNLHSKKSVDVFVFRHLSEAEILLKNSKRKDLKIRVYNSLGTYHKIIGDLSTAMRYFLKALKLAETHPDKQTLASCQSNLGSLYLDKGDGKMGKKHLDICLNILKNDKKNATYLVASHLMANFWGMSNQLDKAMAIDEEGIALANEIQSPLLKGPFMDNKATCLYFTNQVDSAKSYYLQVLALDRLIKNERLESDSYANLANIAMVQHKKQEAIAYIDSSVALAQKTNYKRGMIKAYEILADIYKNESDFKNASHAQDLYMGAYKALMNEKKENSLAQYEISYQTEKKEKKLLQSKIRLAEKEKQIQSRNYWLQMLMVITLAIVGIGFLVYRQLKIRNRQQEQEFELKSAIKEIETQNSLQNQRLQISRDLHDNIGAQLTFIISSVENLSYAFPDENPKVANQLEKINSFAKNTIVELRDTIWAMNSPHISTEDLKARTYNFLEKAQGVKNDIQFTFTISENLLQHDFSALQGVNVYRVLQEAVNNAIKYAQATEISVDLKTGENNIEISVKDNGIGFSKEKIVPGNGLINMEKRTEEIGGKLMIHSEEGFGTTIQIICPKTKEHA
jgi:signal transduction histidine kinase